MRTLTLLVFSPLLMWSYPQLPPKTQPVAKEDRTQTANENRETDRHQASAEQNRAPGQNQVRPLVEEKKADSHTDEELKINRQLAAFTGQLAAFTGRLATFTGWLACFTAGLVIVGGLQVYALIWQAKVLGHHSTLIKQSVEQTRRAVAAYQGFVRASRGMLALTRESNEITKKATGLTRQSLVLTHRPKLAVRNLSPDSQRFVSAGSHAEGRLNIVNIGGAEATVAAIYVDVLLGWNMPATRPYEGKGGEQVTIKLKPGESIWRPFSKEIELLEGAIGSLREAARDRGQGGTFLHVLGFVDYSDELGTPRRTAFCRRYNMNLMRFEKVDNPDYEQED